MALVTSTALIAAVMVSPQTARADITITNSTAATQSLGAGETLTVTNTGTISAAPAVRVSGVAATAVNNSGTIDGGGNTGIFVRSGGDLTTGIDNFGTVTGGLGLSVSSASLSGNITNEAGGIISSPSDTGVYLSHSSVVGGALNNLGTISGAGTGLLLTNYITDIQGGVQNSGTLQGGHYGIWINSDADISGGISNTGSGLISGDISGMNITSAIVHGSITNAAGATITGGTHGIFVRSGSDVTGGIDNSGTIIGGTNDQYGGIDIADVSDVSGGITNRAGGVIKSVVDSAINVYQGSDMTGLINNMGTLSGKQTGIFVGYGNADISGGITNSGTIIGTDTAGIWVQSNGNISGGIDNSGTITGNRGIYTSGGSVRITGGITNEAGGTIEGTGGLAIDLHSLTAVTPININGGRIIGDVKAAGITNGRSPVTIGGDFKTEGNFTVSSLQVTSGNTFDIASGNTVTVDHMLSSTGGGIAFMVTSDASGGYGQLIVNGAGQAVDITGVTISVDVAASPTLVDGDALLVADGVATVTGGPGATPLTVTDNASMWNFQLVDGTYGALGGDASQLYLLVTAGCGDVTISSASSTQQTMCAGETLTVTGTGSISAAPAVVNDGASAAKIANSGTIDGGTKTGIHITNGGDLTAGITNSGTISGSQAILLSGTSDISGGVTNQSGGIISGDKVGIAVYSGSDISGGVDNSGTIVGGTGATLGGIDVFNNSNISGGVINRAGGVIRSVTDAGMNIYNSSDMTGQIQNLGTIEGAQTGIVVYSRSDLSGGLVNSGTLSGAGVAGLWVTSTGDISGGVQNSGLITGGAGIYINGDGSDVSGGITNLAAGRIIGTTTGIAVGTGTADISGGLSNAGTISGGNYGVLVNNSADISGGLTNTSTGVIKGDSGILLQSDMTGAMDNSGTIYGTGQGLYLSGAKLQNTLTNNAGGKISGGTHGIFVNFTADVTGGIDNSGLIEGTVTGGLDFSNVPDFTGDITNQIGGTISSPSSSAINLLNNSNVTGTIYNLGTITAADSGIFVGYGASDLAGGVVNSGLIHGDRFGIYIQGSGAISGGITNNAGGTISGDNMAILVQSTSTTVSPININGGHIIGDVQDDNTALGRTPVTIGGDFTTEGNFTVSSVQVTSGNKLEIASGDTVTVDHMLSSSGGNIAFMVTSDASGGYGQLVVNGAGQAVNISGATISVDVATTPTLADGDALLIADGAATVTGGPGATPQTVTDNSGAWDFKLVDGTYGALGGDATQLYLLVSASTGGSGFTPITPGNAAAETTLNGLGGTTDPQLSQIVTNLGAATTQAEYNDILSSVQPDVSGATYNASLNVLDQSLDLVSNWLDGISSKWESTGLSSGNAPGNSLQGWAQVFGNYATQNTRSNIAGYDAHTAGFAMGVDTGNRYENGKVGLAVSYARTATSSDNANRSENDINSYQVTAYGELKLSEHSFVRGMAAYVRGNTDTTRYDVGGTPGLTAKGSFASNQYTARVIAGHGYMFGHEGTFTPHLLADWTHYTAQDYTETGAGGANLAVSQKAVDLAELGLGLDVDWHFQQESGAVFSPQLRAGYRYDLIGDRLETTAGFAGGGTAFTSPGPVPSRSRFNLGAQLGWQSPADWSAILGYDFDYREGYYAHSGVFKVTDKF